MPGIRCEAGAGKIKAPPGGKKKNMYKPKIKEEPTKWFFYMLDKHELGIQCLLAAIITIIINLLLI